MNKTRRRAVQKHRAKDQKFAARRKAEQEMAGGARARAQMQAPQPATTTTTKSKPTTRARAEAAPVEATPDNTEQNVEQPSE